VVLELFVKPSLGKQACTGAHAWLNRRFKNPWLRIIGQFWFDRIIASQKSVVPKSYVKAGFSRVGLTDAIQEPLTQYLKLLSFDRKFKNHW